MPKYDCLNPIRILSRFTPIMQPRVVICKVQDIVTGQCFYQRETVIKEFWDCE